MSKRALIPLGIFLLLVLLLGRGLYLDPRKLDSVLIDKPVPVFDLATVNNPETRLTNKDLSKDVSMFNVWASWCVSCRQEHPILVELSRHKLVPIYGLNYKDTRKEATGWLDKLGDPYIASAFDEDGRVGIDFGVYGVPETFVVDKKGIIRYKHVGPIDPNSWKETLLPIIEKLRAEQ